MKKTTIITLALAITACTSIDDPEVYDVTRTLTAPGQISVTDATPTSLTISWESVPEAIQYGYILCDVMGNSLSGGTTSETTATFAGLSLYTDYMFRVTALPAVGNGGQSAAAECQVKTSFYDRVDNAEGIYTSYLLNSLGKSYTATLDEDRTGTDYQEGWYGLFTLTRFYEYTSGILVFTVNQDGTISIQNASQYVTEDDVDWALVDTGIKMPASRKQVYIDETSSIFDITTNTLTLTAKFSGTAPQSELFRW